MNIRASGSLAAVVLCTSIALVSTTGCQTYQQQTAEMSASYKTGGLVAAVTTANKQAAEKANDKDAVIWILEQGATLRSAAMADPSCVPPIRPPAPVVKHKEGEPPPPPPPPPPTAEETAEFYNLASINAFNNAENKINFWEEQAKLKLGSEAGALFTNLATLPYRGRAYDKIMVNTYKAITLLQLGRPDDARVELNRAQQRQRDAVEENAKRIAAAQAEADKIKPKEDANGVPAQPSATSYDVDKAKTDPRVDTALSSALAESTANLKPYGDYVNPFTVLLDGLFFLHVGEGGSDIERGLQSIKRVAEIVPENAFIQSELAAAEAIARGQPFENAVTYVIFETGSAPERDQIKIEIPTFLVTSRVPYVAAAFPKLKFNDAYVNSLSIRMGEQSITTSPLASVDNIVAQEFKNEWPLTVTKTIISTATKAIASAVAAKVAEDRGGTMWGLVAKVGGMVYQSSTNIADTRTWKSLPKEFQYARIATPSDRRLELVAGSQTKSVELVPGKINVVVVKSISETAPLLVTQFSLK